MRKFFHTTGILLLLLSGCTGAQTHRADVANQDSDRISVGTVQREIRMGMSGAEVISAIGSPNMVTTDDKRRETWVYDKISTENVSSSSSGGLWLILAGVNNRASARSTTQRTLTIIIKFDEHGLVRDYSYRQSSF
ncbi:MAG: conserved hypothetical protein [Candidatus Desulfovibrio kirbyi]|jgi:outer membrane protein assembly factor BamE (lipoprotein component of BamABCDE complex)|uniref:Lipoprotein SmpA/OmlA domain-containing protein n=1 Tax=Candidatus Desulfovibrio kirbyi TaxID=2696086 RepID=A0A6L2R452_9BACT|nr:hypothetical protein [Desulfovibrio sp.]GFH62293.1 MAG: conserved hypothetical protein [Candidatus Desulfovibrio kirbyi]